MRAFEIPAAGASAKPPKKIAGPRRLRLNVKAPAPQYSIERYIPA